MNLKEQNAIICIPGKGICDHKETATNIFGFVRKAVIFPPSKLYQWT